MEDPRDEALGLQGLLRREEVRNRSCTKRPCEIVEEVHDSMVCIVVGHTGVNA